MKKFLAILLLPLCLNSCDKIGTTRVKNLIDLTPRLTAESPKAHLFTTGNENPFKEAKTHSFSISKRAIIGKPAIASNVMYSVDKEGYVSAFSLKEKKMLWTKDIAGNEIDRHFNSGGILFSDGKLYVTHGTRNLVVLDASSGNEIIRKEFPDVLRSKPVMANDYLLLVQTISNQLIAYNIKTSKITWLHEGGLEIISSKNHVHPVLYNGRVLVSYSSGEVIYLDTSNGSEIWRYTLADSEEGGVPSFEPSVITTTPIIHDNYTYFATSNGKIVKLDLRDGTEIWKKNADDIQSMILHDNNLIVTNNARQVAVLAASNGKIHWVGNLISAKERQSKRPKPVIFLDPFVVKDGNSYILNVLASNGELYQFASDDGGNLPEQPAISQTEKDLRYYWISCCNGAIHLITNTKIKF